MLLPCLYQSMYIARSEHAFLLKSTHSQMASKIDGAIVLMNTSYQTRQLTAASALRATD